MLKAIDSWWVIHPHLVEIILFIITLFAALFPERARRFVLAPVYYPALRALGFMQKDAANQLKIMRLVDGDAYKLVAYLSFYCVHAVLWSLRGTIVLAILLALSSIWHKGPIDFRLLPLIFFAGLIGRTVRLYSLLSGLFNPEETIKRLEKMAAGERV